MSEERLLFIVEGLDADAAAELARTAPPGIRANEATLATYSMEVFETACVIVYATAGIAGVEGVKIVTKWLIEGLRGLVVRRVREHATAPLRVTIDRREVDFEEGAIRRVVEEHIHVEGGANSGGDLDS